MMTLIFIMKRFKNIVNLHNGKNIVIKKLIFFCSLCDLL